VFPEVGKCDYELTASVLNMLEPPQNGIQLARHSEEEVSALKRQLAQLNYTPVTGVSVVEEDVMDWRYPARILDTETVLNLQGKVFKDVRTKFRRAAKVVEHTPLNQENALKFMRAALKFWEGNMIFNAKDTSDMSDFYIALFRIMEENPEAIDGLFFMQGRKSLGFSVWDTPSAGAANLLVSLCDTSVAELADYQVIESCRALHERGVETLNMGGSETQSLDSFKAKYQPRESLKVLSADVSYRQVENVNVEVRELVPIHR